MKGFFKDYKELCVEAGRFYKKHWIGVIIANLVSIGIMFVGYAVSTKGFEKRIDCLSPDVSCVKEEEEEL